MEGAVVARMIGKRPALRCMKRAWPHWIPSRPIVCSMPVVRALPAATLLCLITSAIGCGSINSADDLALTYEEQINARLAAEAAIDWEAIERGLKRIPPEANTNPTLLYRHVAALLEAGHWTPSDPISYPISAADIKLAKLVLDVAGRWQFDNATDQLIHLMPAALRHQAGVEPAAWLEVAWRDSVSDDRDANLKADRVLHGAGWKEVSPPTYLTMPALRWFAEPPREVQENGVMAAKDLSQPEYDQIVGAAFGGGAEAAFATLTHQAQRDRERALYFNGLAARVRGAKIAVSLQTRRRDIGQWVGPGLDDETREMMKEMVRDGGWPGAAYGYAIIAGTTNPGASTGCESRWSRTAPTMQTVGWDGLKRLAINDGG